jgi:hypothetical protein
MSEMVPVVLRFRDGRVVRVTLPGNEAPHAVVNAVDEAGEDLEVLLNSLKGVFYLKAERERVLGLDADAAAQPSGPTATVEFDDGEVLTGRVAMFDVRQPGFFLIPAETQSNNAKVYVVTAAVRSLELRP